MAQGQQAHMFTSVQCQVDWIVAYLHIDLEILASQFPLIHVETLRLLCHANMELKRPKVAGCSSLTHKSQGRSNDSAVHLSPRLSFRL